LTNFIWYFNIAGAIYSDVTIDIVNETTNTNKITEAGKSEMPRTVEETLTYLLEKQVETDSKLMKINADYQNLKLDNNHLTVVNKNLELEIGSLKPEIKCLKQENNNLKLEVKNLKLEIKNLNIENQKIHIKSDVQQTRIERLEFDQDYDKGCTAVRQIILLYEELLYDDIREIYSNKEGVTPLKTLFGNHKVFRSISTQERYTYIVEITEAFKLAHYNRSSVHNPSLTMASSNDEYFLMRRLKEGGDKVVHNNMEAFRFTLDRIVNHPTFILRYPDTFKVTKALVTARNAAINSNKFGLDVFAITS